MSCPFGYGSLQQAQRMAEQMEQRNGNPQPANGAAEAPVAAPANGASSPEVSSASTSPQVASSSTSSPESNVTGPGSLFPPTRAAGHLKLPLGLWTGGLRRSLGVENAHPISVWMKEMQSRGGLKGIDIEKELLGFETAGGVLAGEPESASSDGAEPAPALQQSQLEQLDELTRQQHAKNWKEKRERPPAEFDAFQPAAAPAPTGSPGPFLPGATLAPRINHNRYLAQPPAERYDQEITYWNYIHPAELASLQTGRQGKGLNHHEEHLFILVHQVFELWFKQILWEMEYVRNVLIGYRDPNLPALPRERNPLTRAVQRLDRADKILRLATEGYAIMETMDPADFLEFRDFLSPSSGFQSVQLREIEIILGLKDDERLACAGRHYREAFMANGENKTPIFDQRLREHTLKDGLYIWLRRHLPSSRLDEFLQAYFSVIDTQNSEKSKDFDEELALLEKMRARTNDAREISYLKDLTEKARFGRQLARNSAEDVRAFFADPLLGKQRAAILYLFTYHTHPACAPAAALVNGFLLFEQAVILWRQRHARMVEMFIGRRPGTGGSSGVEYIDNTAQQYRIFTDLWRIRSLCVSRSKLAFDPDEGALSYAEAGTQMDTDIARVEEEIRAETQRIKDAAKAQQKQADGSVPAAAAAAAVGGAATSSTSIAAGIGPGAGVGQTAV